MGGQPRLWVAVCLFYCRHIVNVFKQNYGGRGGGTVLGAN